jgi:amidase
MFVETKETRLASGLLRFRLVPIAFALYCTILPASEPGAFELDELTIKDLQEGMHTGTYSARSIVETYLAHVEEIDKKGPTLRSYMEINPDALAIADQRDQERGEGGVRGPLQGIPVLVKDNIETADNLQTTAGSYALEDVPGTRDSFVAQKLREAGAVIIGKANMSEWAYFRSTRASSGWSARGGQTKNPYILTRNPCGSSSGSAVAVAANLVTIAIGTETDGSIVCPASANSIVGIKPTVGLISRAGIIPISPSQDTAGPMARTVSDAALLLGALTGIDPQDPRTEESRGKSYSDYTQFLQGDGLRGARIGIARNYFGYHEHLDSLINSAIHVMKHHGAVITDPANVETAGQFGDSEFTVLLYEFKASFEEYLRKRSPSGPQSLKELIAFNEQHRAIEMPYFEQEIFAMADQKGPLTDKAYVEARKHSYRLAATEGIDATLKKYNLDVIVAPTFGPAFPIDLTLGDHIVPPWKGPQWLPSAPAVAGYPHISVPAGYVSGIPVGISFIGGAFTEPTLIKIAYAFEQATKYRKPPEFLPHDPVP